MAEALMGMIVGFGAASVLCLAWRERERRLRKAGIGTLTGTLAAALVQLAESIEREAFDPGLLRQVADCRDLAATLAGVVTEEGPPRTPATRGPAASDRPNAPPSEGSGPTAYDEARLALHRDLAEATAALDHGTTAAERLGFLVEDQGITARRAVAGPGGPPAPGRRGGGRPDPLSRTTRHAGREGGSEASRPRHVRGGGGDGVRGTDVRQAE